MPNRWQKDCIYPDVMSLTVNEFLFHEEQPAIVRLTNNPAPSDVFRRVSAADALSETPSPKDRGSEVAHPPAELGHQARPYLTARASPPGPDLTPSNPEGHKPQRHSHKICEANARCRAASPCCRRSMVVLERHPSRNGWIWSRNSQHRSPKIKYKTSGMSSTTNTATDTGF